MQLIDNALQAIDILGGPDLYESTKLEIPRENINQIKSYKILLQLIFYDKSKINRMKSIRELKNVCSQRRYIHILIIAEKTEISLENKIQIRKIVYHSRRHKKHTI